MNFLYILLSIICIILILIVWLSIDLYRQSRGSTNIDEIINASPYRKRKIETMIPHNDFLARNKVFEKRKAEEKEKYSSLARHHDQGQAESELEQKTTEIVGLAKPVGFWTRFIMNQKLSFIMARMRINKKYAGKLGPWVSLILAQANSQGKDQTKGR